MARIEWFSSLYRTPQKGYYLKAGCFEGAFLAAAKTQRLGKAFKLTVSIPDDPELHFPDEALMPGELFTREEYVSYMAVRVQNKKIFRCRPVFARWHCTVELLYNDEQIGADTLREIAVYAGRFIGVGDFRPNYGRFEVAGTK